MNIDSEIKEFLKEIFKEEICEETDTEMKRKIYMPQSIKTLMQVPVVARMNRILQNGTNMYDTISMIGTRMQHLKGTYSLMLELLVNLWKEDKRFKQRVIERGQQKYIKAILVKEILHDIGHGPFSHTLETICNLPKGFHEKIGNRLLIENKELNEALNNIEQGLPETILELDKEDVLGLKRLCEGQFDVDRADFVARDNYFMGKDYKRSIQINQELIQNVRTAEYTDENKNTKIIPVFKESQIGNIEEFLQNRYDNYIGYYQNNKKYVDEQIFKVFGIEAMKMPEDTLIKRYLNNINRKSPEEVDLNEYTEIMDDIEYLKETVKAIEIAQDETIKKLGLMTIPPINAISGLCYGVMLDSEDIASGNKQCSESDEIFLDEIRKMIELRNTMASNGNFMQENCILLDTDKKDEIIQFVARIQNLLMNGENRAHGLNGLQVWNNTTYFYRKKENEEIYIQAQDGKSYEYSEHPNTTRPIKKVTRLGMCIIIPELEKEGHEKAKIDKIRYEMIQFNTRRRKQEHEDR